MQQLQCAITILADNVQQNRSSIPHLTAAASTMFPTIERLAALTLAVGHSFEHLMVQGRPLPSSLRPPFLFLVVLATERKKTLAFFTKIKNDGGAIVWSQESRGNGSESGVQNHRSGVRVRVGSQGFRRQ